MGGSEGISPWRCRSSRHQTQRSALWVADPSGCCRFRRADITTARGLALAHLLHFRLRHIELSQRPPSAARWRDGAHALASATVLQHPDSGECLLLLLLAFIHSATYIRSSSALLQCSRLGCLRHHGHFLITPQTMPNTTLRDYGLILATTSEYATTLSPPRPYSFQTPWPSSGHFQRTGVYSASFQFGGREV